MALSDLRQMLCLALDVPSLEEAKPILKQLAGGVGTVKFGHALTQNAGGLSRLVKALKPFHCQLFWDAKLCDAPDTMVRDAKEAARAGVNVITVHATNNTAEGISAVVKAVPDMKVLVVTVLTTMSEDEVRSIYHTDLDRKVWEFALQAKAAKAGGIVCAPIDIGPLRQRDVGFKHCFIATPGIRPAWHPKSQQKRTLPPGKALLAGSGLLIIGGPILNPPPEIGGSGKALELITAEMMQAKRERPNDT